MQYTQYKNIEYTTERDELKLQPSEMLKHKLSCDTEVGNEILDEIKFLPNSFKISFTSKIKKQDVFPTTGQPVVKC